MKKKITLSIIIVLILSLVGGTVYYINDYYHAEETAVSLIATPKENVVVTEENGVFTFKPQNATDGFIFYPGGKVEHNAYQPLMAALARRGILCVLVKMPFNLAVFDINAADGIHAQYPEIENWYIGGHSLGGSMAASYLANHANEYDGLILLGSYSTADLSDTELNILSIYGSEDLVLNREKYSKNKSNLPADLTEVVIDGGCHAYFGMYGAQDGDGTPSISNHQQIQITVENIVKTCYNDLQ
jgi:hypothetical protein